MLCHKNIYELLLASNLFTIKLLLISQLILFAGGIVLGDNGYVSSCSVCSGLCEC
jgi:hypothetical protein